MYVNPQVKDFEIQRGDDFSFTFDIEIDGVVLVLTNYNVYSSIRTAPESSSTLIDDFTVSVNGSNEITLSLTAAETAAITHGTGYYDVLVVSDTGDKTHYLKGCIAFYGTVTEEP